VSVIWHDLECGAYDADLPLWRDLAARYGEPILDIGAGTGRVSLDLARRGYRVTALDQDDVLLSELARRAGSAAVTTVRADARSFALKQRFALILVPMQTIQLLGGPSGRGAFLTRAARHLRSGGALAIAITDRLEKFAPEDDEPLPLPDMRELDGIVYSSQPIAVRERRDGFVLERVRETIGRDGERSSQPDVVQMDRLSAGELEAEARAAGLTPRDTRIIGPTPDHVGSLVVILGD
jgi:SAM-dependent methyltransferase